MKISNIHNKIKINLLVSLLATTSYSQAIVANALNPSTSLGVNAVYSGMKFKKDYGSNIFSSKMAPGLNVFVRHMFNETWGAEIGYEMYKKMKRTGDVYAGSNLLGIFLNPALIDSYSYKASESHNHSYLGAIAKFNLLDDKNIFSVMLGVSSTNIKNKLHIFQSITGGVISEENIHRTFTKNKLVPIARVGFERKFTEKFGVHALIGWKNLSKFKIRTEETDSDCKVRLKDNVNFGIGFNYYI